MSIAEQHLNVAGAAVGDNLPCFCPFHKEGQERSPSFYMYIGPDTDTKATGMSFCHTCDKGWSIISLLKELGVQGKKIDQYTELLPARQKVDQDNPAALRRAARKLCFDNPRLPEEILAVYEHCPTKLLNNGFSMEILKQHEIGFDHEKSRITFPLRDHMGWLAGISGRAHYTHDSPRYLFYAQNDLPYVDSKVSGYKLYKGRLVWNLHKFYPTSMVTTLPYMVVVEGFKAGLWLIQNGVEYTVALMGVHMTKEQETLLLRLGCPLYVFLDNDEAGIGGTKQIIKRLSKQTPRAYQVHYPKGTEGASPDDLECIDSLLEARNARPIREWNEEFRRQSTGSGESQQVQRENSPIRPA